MTDVGVATGCLYQLGMGMEEEIEYIRGLGADGIELTFTDADEVRETSPELVDGLDRAFDFVTLHAPIRSSVDDDDDLAWVRDLERLRQRAGGAYIVFHPPKVPSLPFVADEATVAVENMQRRKGFDRDDLDAFLDGWEGPVVIDTCHAATWGEDGVDHLFDTYGDRCGHVHLSAYGDEEHERVVDHPQYLDRLSSYLDDRRVVLEHRAPTRDALDEEYGFVRELLP